MLATFAAAALAAAGCGGEDGEAEEAGGEERPLVAFLVPSSTGQPRWEKQDAPAFVNSMKKYAPNARVQVFNANDDVAKQQAQAEAALTNGADVLVVVALDSVSAGAIVDAAKREDVPVIAYARPIENSPFDYFVTADVPSMGRIQAQWIVDNTSEGAKIAIIAGATDDVNAHIIRDAYTEVLQPALDAGKLTIVSDTFTPAWDPVKAQQQMEQILTKENNDIQGVLVSNDGMAGGVIAALRSQNLTGKVVVTGLDANIEALQRVLKGEQSMTILIPIRDQGDKAAQIAAALVNGEEPDESLFDDEPFVSGELRIPRVFVEVVPITKDTVDLVIKDGGATKAEVCAGVPPGTGFC
jgi:D-xylose transport system substrate-binding protein